MYKKNVKIRQFDKSDCGAACLSSVCAYHGLYIPLARVRQYAFTNRKGTNVLGLIEAANRLGLSAKGVRAEADALLIVPKPTIAHVIINEKLHHYVVIYKTNTSKKYLVYMDPADGNMHKISFEEFKKMWTGVLVILEKKETFKTGNLKNNPIEKFLSLLSPHKDVIIQAAFGALIYSILGLSTSIYIGKITDYVLVDKNANLLNLMSIIMILIAIFRSYIGGMKSILVLKIGQRIDITLLLGYYKHLLSLPQQFFDTMRTGEIISRVNDAVKIRNFINNVSLDILVNSMILSFSFLCMCIYSWKLTLIASVSLPLFLFVFRLYNKWNKKYQRKVMESCADLETQLVESVNAISTIKRFGMEEYANMKTESCFIYVLKNTYHSVCSTVFTRGSTQFISSAITVCVLWIGSLQVINQEITPGELMVFYSLLGYILSPIASLINVSQNVQDARIAADRLFQIMDLECEKNDTSSITLTEDMIGDIVFDSVSFRYGTQKNIFENLNLTIKKGKTTAIVGGSGSGKTTIAALIQRIYPIQKGCIRIGGYDISLINNQSIREQICSVPQQIELFAGTLVENIAVGDWEPDIKRICKLIEELGLRTFVEELPQGLNTYISENGVSLSGGERQRIAIARALYKRPEILILDEATSSLDSHSEYYVKQVLEHWVRQNKTIIIIAHRLNTIKNADEIVVLEKGKVIETGKHRELYDLKGTYYHLWQNSEC